MTKQNEKKPKQTKRTAKIASARARYIINIVNESLFAANPDSFSVGDLSKKRNKDHSGTADGSKKKKMMTERTSHAEASRDSGSSPSTEAINDSSIDEVEVEVEKENDEKRSKHYEDQQKLHEDWDREKSNLLNRYFMSFSNGKNPDPRITEVYPLASCTECAYEEETSVDVYLLNKHFTMKVKHCGCCSLAEALVQMQLMPKTIKAPRTAVHFGLLDLFQKFETSSQVSSGAMASVLNWMNAKNDAPSISESTLNDTRVCYQRFIFFTKQYVFEKQGVNFVLDVCLPCEASGTYEYMMDANFSLKRLSRKKELVSYQVAEETRVWVTQSEVESAASAEKKAKEDAKKKGKGREIKESTVCDAIKDSNIRAAQGDKRSGRDGYAANGIFAMVCRHGMINKFVDVPAGETHSLALACVKKVVEENSGKQKPYFLTYDIMCRMKDSVKRLIPHEVVGKSQFALPVLHCYGHKMHCQMEYSPRYLAGFGLTDGEGIERFWSFLGEFTKLTRGMTKANRQITLLTAAKEYGAQKMASIGEHLYDHYVKALDVIKKANKDLGGDNADRLLATWSTVRTSLAGGTATVSTLGNSYHAYCIRYYDAEKELDEEEDEDARLVLDTKMRRFKKMVIEAERELRRTGGVALRPRVDEECISRLRPLLVEEKKAEHLLIICTSVYIIKALRPLIKGRRGKAGVQMAERLNKQILKERSKAEAAIKSYNTIVRKEKQGTVLPTLRKIDRGEFTSDQAEILFNGVDSKTMSMFMKLRAQEELQYIKTIAANMKDIETKRLAKFAEVLFALNADIKSKLYTKTETAKLVGVRCVIASMCEFELEWWHETCKFLTPVLAYTSPLSSAP